MIKAVFFDLGGTLLDNVTFLEKYATKANQKILKSLGYNFTLKEIQKARLKAIEHIENCFKTPKKHTPGLYNFYFLKFLGIKPSMKLAVNIAKEFNLEWDKHKRLMPYAKELLEFVKKKKLKIVLISNGSVKNVNHDLRLTKIKKYFDLIVISEKLGKEKSALVPFEYALKKLKLRPREVIIIGDRIDEDINPGKKLGCMTIRMDYGFWRDYKVDVYEEADYVVRNLREIKSIIANKL